MALSYVFSFFSVASKAQRAFEKFYGKEIFWGVGELEGWSAEDVGELLDIFEQKAPEIKLINMAANKLSDEATTAVGGKLRKLSKLEKLALGDNEIGDAGVTAIARELADCDKLESLALHGNQIGDVGATALARELAGCNKLTSLWLSNNQIGDAGATAIARELAGCDKLTTLSLNNNQIGDVGATALARELAGCDKLTSLSLSVDPKRVDWPAMGWSIPHEQQQEPEENGRFNWVRIAQFMGENKVQYSGQ